MPLSTAAPLSAKPLHRKSEFAPVEPSAKGCDSSCHDVASRDWRLHNHADYQRVYRASRKQFSTSMTYFVATQPARCAGTGPRVGITCGKVLGKAVERNRIKRRMRAAIVSNLDALDAQVDVVLHPKRSVLTAEWHALRNEVRRVFVKIEESQRNDMSERSGPEPTA